MVSSRFVHAGLALLALGQGCFNPKSGDDTGAGTDDTSGTGSATIADDDDSPTADDDDDDGPTSSPTAPTTDDPDTSAGPGPETTDTDTDGPPPMCGDGAPTTDEFCPPDAPTTFVVGNDAFDVVIADLDGAALDIATANRTSGTVSVLLGDGVGGFGDANGEAVLGEPVRIRAADADGDGDIDFVTGPFEISTLVNDGSGELTRYDSVDVGGGASFSEDMHAELNVIQGDGTDALDILITAEYDSNFAPGFSGPGWTFGPPVGTGANNEGATGLVATEFEFDGDGFIDAVAVGQYQEDTQLLLGQGDGTFDVMPGPESCPSEEYEGGRFVDVADLNGDANVDLVITCMTADFTVHLGEDDGTFAPAVRLPRAGAQKVALGDLDGDGDIDVGVSSNIDNNLAIYLNDGAGTLAEPVHLAIDAPSNTIAFGDLDGDGALDVVTAYDDGTGGRVAVFLSEP